MKNLSSIFRKAEEAGKRGKRQLDFDVNHEGARNTNRVNPRDPLADSAPAMLPWSAHNMVTGSRTFFKYARAEAFINRMLTDPTAHGGKPNSIPGVAPVRLSRKNIMAERPGADPLFVAKNRYDPFKAYRPGGMSNSLGIGTRRVAEGVGRFGAVPGAAIGGTVGGGIGYLASKLMGGKMNPKLMAAIGALIGGGAGGLAGRAFKKASFWEQDANNALMDIVRAVSGVSFSDRTAMQQAVGGMGAGQAQQILSMLGPMLGGAGAGALLVKLILGGGNARMLGGAMAGAMLTNMLRRGGEEKGLNIYGQRISI